MMELSNPDMQAVCEYLPIEKADGEGILHLYYDMTVYYGKRMWLEPIGGGDEIEGRAWKKQFRIRVGDFPEILCFKAILKELRDAEPDSTWQMTPAGWGDRFSASKTMDTMTFCSEDYYEVRRIVSDAGRIVDGAYEFGEEEIDGDFVDEEDFGIEDGEKREPKEFRITIGRGMDVQADVEVKSVSFPASKSDVDAVISMIDRFMRKAVDKRNREVETLKKEKTSLLRPCGNALHAEEKGSELGGIGNSDEPAIDEIFRPGTKIEATYVDDGKQIEVRGRLLEVLPGGIRVEGKYARILSADGKERIEEKDEVLIPYEKTAWISKDLFFGEDGNENVGLGIEECERIFEEELNDEEIREIAESDEEEAVRRYAWAFINSFALMRDEHNLPRLDFDYEEYEDDWGRSQANALVHAKEALKRIRKRLLEKSEKIPKSV